jgi:hypothetical protein
MDAGWRKNAETRWMTMKDVQPDTGNLLRYYLF